MVMGIPGKTNKRVEYITAPHTYHHDGRSTVPNRSLWVLETTYSTPENTSLTYVLGDIKVCLNNMGSSIGGC